MGTRSGDRVEPALFDHVGYKIGAETIPQMAVIADAQDQQIGLFIGLK